MRSFSQVVHAIAIIICYAIAPRPSPTTHLHLSGGGHAVGHYNGRHSTTSTAVPLAPPKPPSPPPLLLKLRKKGIANGVQKAQQSFPKIKRRA
uniref:Uncharacterized protein n=1 Tax=Anopheles dirus TaxID=7168 RepID=A0A182NY53_9DIPT